MTFGRRASEASHARPRSMRTIDRWTRSTQIRTFVSEMIISFCSKQSNALLSSSYANTCEKKMPTTRMNIKESTLCLDLFIHETARCIVRSVHSKDIELLPLQHMRAKKVKLGFQVRQIMWREFLRKRAASVVALDLRVRMRNAVQHIALHEDFTAGKLKRRLRILKDSASRSVVVASTSPSLRKISHRRTSWVFLW